MCGRAAPKVIPCRDVGVGIFVKDFFFTQGDGEALEQLPPEAVNAPTLDAFKARLDGILGSLI